MRLDALRLDPNFLTFDTKCSFLRSISLLSASLPENVSLLFCTKCLEEGIQRLHLVASYLFLGV